MANSTLIQLKVDTKIKKQADNLFANMGLDTPTAIRIFLNRAIIHRGIPFDVIYEESNECPLCKNLLLSEEAFNEAEEINKHPEKFKTYSNFSEILEEVEKE